MLYVILSRLEKEGWWTRAYQDMAMLTLLQREGVLRPRDITQRTLTPAQRTINGELESSCWHLYGFHNKEDLHRVLEALALPLGVKLGNRATMSCRVAFW